MTLRHALSTQLDSFNYLSVNQPIGIIWDGKGMQMHQLNKMWRVNKLFFFAYKPKKPFYGVLTPEDVQGLSNAAHELREMPDDIMIVPKELGYDIYGPSEIGNPELLREIRFFTLRSTGLGGKISMLLLSMFSRKYKPVVKTLKDKLSRL